MTVHPTAALMRRFVVDWLDRADASVPPVIMAPDYTIVIAGVEMVGRDAYLEATTGQLARFPGLTVTVHDALYTGDGRAALRFTEHGASARGGSAAWRGIGLFRAEESRRGVQGSTPTGEPDRTEWVLVHNATEEDYLGRRRQLQGGVPDAVDPPMVAPWTEPPADPDPAAEEIVRAWLDGGAGPVAGVVADDGHGSPPGAALLDADEVAVTALFSAGRRVAVHATVHGRYAGGLPGSDAEPGAAAAVGLAAIVDVDGDGALRGHVVRDRLGLHRALGR